MTSPAKVMDLDPTAGAIVENGTLAVLALNTPHGPPHATVVWYLYEGGAFWMNVAAQSRKARYLRRDPHFSLTIDEREWPYRGIVIRGRAEPAPFDEEQARRLAVRSLGRERGIAMHEHMVVHVPRLRFRLVPEHAYHWDFGG